MDVAEPCQTGRVWDVQVGKIKVGYAPTYAIRRYSSIVGDVKVCGSPEEEFQVKVEYIDNLSGVLVSILDLEVASKSEIEYVIDNIRLASTRDSALEIVAERICRLKF